MTEQLTLSVPEAAKALGVGMHAVYRAVRERRVPALRIGTKPKFRIPRVAIDRLLEDPERWQAIGVEESEAQKEIQE